MDMYMQLGFCNIRLNYTAQLMYGLFTYVYTYSTLCAKVLVQYEYIATCHSYTTSCEARVFPDKPQQLVVQLVCTTVVF